MHQLEIKDVGRFSPILADRVCLSTSIGLLNVIERLMPMFEVSDVQRQLTYGSIPTFGRIGRTYAGRFAVVNSTWKGQFFPYMPNVPYMEDWADEPERLNAIPNAAPFVRFGDHVEPDTVVGIIWSMGFCIEMQAMTKGIFDRYLVKEAESLEHGVPVARIRLR